MAFLTATLGTKAALALLVFALVWLRLWQIERHGEEEQQAAREEAERLRVQTAARKGDAAASTLLAFTGRLKRNA
jgi:hypothetical protein